MDKRKVSELAEISFIDGKLDEKSLNKIIGQLNGMELREYLKILKERQEKLDIYIDHSFDLSEQDKKKFIEAFSKKHVVFRNDLSLVFGIRITDNDMVYNLHMKSALDQIKNYLNRMS